MNQKISPTRLPSPWATARHDNALEGKVVLALGQILSLCASYWQGCLPVLRGGCQYCPASVLVQGTESPLGPQECSVASAGQQPDKELLSLQPNVRGVFPGSPGISDARSSYRAIRVPGFQGWFSWLSRPPDQTAPSQCFQSPFSVLSMAAPLPWRGTGAARCSPPEFPWGWRLPPDNDRCGSNLTEPWSF